MKFGYSSDIGEITPSIFLNLSKIARAKVFLTLYNSCVNEPLRLPMQYAQMGDLKAIFTRHINHLLRFECNQGLKPKSLCLVSSDIINRYKMGEKLRFDLYAKEPRLPVAKMIKMLYASGRFELFFDAEFMFFEFVYGKIASKHSDKNVYFQDGVIYIEQNGKNLLAVMPSFKQVCSTNARNLKCEIDKAVRILNSNKCDSLYVVCPRNSDFKHHIEIKHCECFGKSIKLVPYMINNKIF